MNQWEKKLQNLNQWWQTAKIDNDKPVNIYKYFKLDKLKGSILDVGCGQPKGTWYIDEFKDYTGLDPAPANKDIIKGVAEDIPFDDNHFDYVLCMSTLQHCKDPELAISEMERVCKKKIFASVYCSKPNDLIVHEFDIIKVTELFARYFQVLSLDRIEDVVYVEGLCT